MWIVRLYSWIFRTKQVYEDYYITKPSGQYVSCTVISRTMFGTTYYEYKEY